MSEQLVQSAPEPPGLLTVEFAGEEHTVTPGDAFVAGREGDLSLDSSLALPRHLLDIRSEGGLWWVENLSESLSVAATDASGRLHAMLAPGSRLPVVFESMSVVFTAGRTTYELGLIPHEPMFGGTPVALQEEATGVLEDVRLTAAQHVVIVALAEPILRGGASRVDIPTSTAAAARLGWTLTRFNRKLDNVCAKLARAGVEGLHGQARAHATNRRARLVEHALAARLVTRADLPLLDQELAGNAVSRPEPLRR